MEIERRYCQQCKTETDHVRNAYHREVLTCTICLKVTRQNVQSSTFPLPLRPAI